MGKNKIDLFIKNHHHISYCEAILFENGDIQYAIPSHQQSLINIALNRYEISMDELNEMIPYDASPLYWLVEDLNCISLWFYECVAPSKITEFQKESLIKLQEANIIANHFIIKTSVEKTLLELRNDGNNDGINNLKRESFLLADGKFIPITNLN